MDDDNEDYGFTYSDDDDELEEDVDIENQYYNSKAALETDVAEALTGFEEVLKMENEQGEWGFKALKQIVKILFRQGDFDGMLKRYKDMLTYIRSAVTRNYSEKTINSILEFVSSSEQLSLLQQFYETTLGALQEAQNGRLWFKTNLKLGELWFDKEEYGRVSKVLKELHRSCQKADGTNDQKKGTQLLEIYALEIQMYTATKNNNKLKDLYERALEIRSAITHPRIMGIIRECGGKMHMGDQNFENAYSDFYEAFKNYDEAGTPRRIQCLKYLVLANMLSLSEINPFDSPEAKPYTNNPEIVAMTNLVGAYTRKDINEFENLLKDNRSIMEDAFIRDHIQDLLGKVRTQVLLKLIKPYTRIGLQYACGQLNIPEDELESLLVSLILDGTVDGSIDQVSMQLILTTENSDSKKYEGIEKWSTQLKHILASVTATLQ